MAVLFLLDGDWLLLPVCLLALMWGARLADSERVARLVAGEGDEDALSMLFEPIRSHSLLPLDHFRCRELMFYRSGWPVYRFLRSSRCWFEFVGESEHITALTEQHILVFPGVCICVGMIWHKTNCHAEAEPATPPSAMPEWSDVADCVLSACPRKHEQIPWSGEKTLAGNGFAGLGVLQPCYD